MGKTLFLVRHGIAVDCGERGVSRDSDRMLSAEGREKTVLAAKGFASMGVAPEKVFSSPLIRARETAELFSKALGQSGEFEETDYLGLGLDSNETVGWLRTQKADSFMLVGHMPDLADLASLLLTGEMSMGIRFKKASVCCLFFSSNLRKGTGELAWHLQPKQLRLLAGAE